MLALEDVDIALASFNLIGNLLPMLLAERRTAPDEIYVAKTHTNPWWAWPMKRDGDHWPGVGMSEWNQTMRGQDELRTLDELYAPHVSKWDPTAFDEGELGDLSMGRGSKRV